MENENRRIVEEYLSCYNRRDVSSMLKLFSDDMQFESISNTNGTTLTTTKEQYNEFSKMNVEFFEERQQTAIHWVVSEDSVAIETEFWCRLAKDLPDGPKAGEGMRYRGASFFSIENGLIKRLVDYM